MNLKIIDADGDSIELFPLDTGVEIEVDQETSRCMSTVVLTWPQAIRLAEYILSASAMRSDTPQPVQPSGAPDHHD